MTARAYLLLRLEAPLMAFGGPMVDQIGPTLDFPGPSLLAGLLGNALGLCHADAGALEALQARLRPAALLVRPGRHLCDYQTVALGQPHLVGTGWTTRGRPESRNGASSEDTHIRYRWYLADALVAVALALEPADVPPTLADLAAALDHPARPLFLGRKSCLPVAPLRLGEIVSASGPLEALRLALQRLPGAPAASRLAEIDARLFAAMPPGAEADRLIDLRDWHNQMHTGGRRVYRLNVPLAAEAMP